MPCHRLSIRPLARSLARTIATSTDIGAVINSRLDYEAWMLAVRAGYSQIRRNVSEGRARYFDNAQPSFGDPVAFRSGDLPAHTQSPANETRRWNGEISASLNNYGYGVHVRRLGRTLARGTRVKNVHAMRRRRPVTISRASAGRERRIGRLPSEIRLIILSIWTASLPERGAAESDG
jgi:hypothetical protein